MSSFRGARSTQHDDSSSGDESYRTGHGTSSETVLTEVDPERTALAEAPGDTITKTEEVESDDGQGASAHASTSGQDNQTCGGGTQDGSTTKAELIEAEENAAAALTEAINEVKLRSVEPSRVNVGDQSVDRDADQSNSVDLSESMALNTQGSEPEQSGEDDEVEEKMDTSAPLGSLDDDPDAPTPSAAKASVEQASQAADELSKTLREESPLHIDEDDDSRVMTDDQGSGGTDHSAKKKKKKKRGSRGRRKQKSPRRSSPRFAKTMTVEEGPTSETTEGPVPSPSAKTAGDSDEGGHQKSKKAKGPKKPKTDKAQDKPKVEHKKGALKRVRNRARVRKPLSHLALLNSLNQSHPGLFRSRRKTQGMKWRKAISTSSAKNHGTRLRKSSRLLERRSG